MQHSNLVAGKLGTEHEFMIKRGAVSVCRIGAACQRTRKKKKKSIQPKTVQRIRIRYSRLEHQHIGESISKSHAIDELNNE